MHIAVWYNLPSGGARRALSDQIRGLSARGHRVDVWRPALRQDVSGLDLGTPERHLRLHLDGATPAWARLVPYAHSGGLQRMRAMALHAAEFGHAVNAIPYDVVFANSCEWMSTPFVGRYIQHPSILYLPEPHRRTYEARPALPWIAEPEPEGAWWHPGAIKRWLGSAARANVIRVQAREELVSVQSFDRVLVNSYFSRDTIRALFNVEAKVCYLGVDAARFALYEGPRDPVALSVGEFAPHKNPQFLVRAIAASRTRPALVWIANRVDADCLAQATQLAQALGVTLSVRVAVPDDALVAQYQRASIFLYAPVLEPFGLAPLEANACGTPVICAVSGGVRETIVNGENGVIGDFDAQEMGREIDALLGDAARARRLGQTGAARVRSLWTLEAALDRLEAQLLWASGQPKRAGIPAVPPRLPSLGW